MLNVKTEEAIEERKLLLTKLFYVAITGTGGGPNHIEATIRALISCLAPVVLAERELPCDDDFVDSLEAVIRDACDNWEPAPC